MGTKIGVISRSQEFLDLIHTQVPETVQITARQANYLQAVGTALNIAPSVDIIIARGRTADLIKKSVNIPVINCDFQPIDILTTLSNVPADSYPLALIREESEVGRSLATLGLVERLWGHKLELITYTNYNTLETQLQNAIVKGIRGVIGGGLVVEMAAQYGLRKTELVISKETVKFTIEKALLIAESLEQTKRNNFYISSILNAIDSICIIANNVNNIVYISPQIGMMTGLEINDKISSIFPTIVSPELIRQLKNGKPLKGLTFNIPGSNNKINYNLTPLFDKDNKYNGYLVQAILQENITVTQGYNKHSSKDQHLNTKYSLKDIIGSSEPIIYAKNLAREYAKSNLNILVYGETGTGKELFAHSIHQLSNRCQYPFVAVNCAALPPNLLESELFGYEEGAFTGARKGGKKGLFELANFGTIFLDEIGELPLEIQARLLRVLQSREIMRLGGNSQIPVNVRVLSATNKDLEKAVQNGTFRSDLFFRLNTLFLTIPALKDRRADIPLLVDSFLPSLELTPGIQKSIKNYIDDLLVDLSNYSWPGNVRELRNLVERCNAEFNLLQQGIVKPSDLLRNNNSLNSETPDPYKALTTGNIKNTEIELIYAAGKQVNWNRKKMAEILGISLSTLWRKMKENKINF